VTVAAGGDADAQEDAISAPADSGGEAQKGDRIVVHGVLPRKCAVRDRDSLADVRRHPVGMKGAVISPQAMNAPMLGITMPARLPPRRWIFALRPPPVTVGVYRGEELT